jgi:hypothetical protein
VHLRTRAVFAIRKNGRVALQRMDNVGIVVESLDAAISFFAELGLELEGRAMIEGDWSGPQHIRERRPGSATEVIHELRASTRWDARSGLSMDDDASITWPAEMSKTQLGSVCRH